VSTIVVTTSTPITGFRADDSPEFSGLAPIEFTFSERGFFPDSALTFGEVVDVLAGEQAFSAQYLGFLTLDGLRYPAFENSWREYFVVGRALDFSVYPNFGVVVDQLNRSVPFTDFAAVCFGPGTGIATPDGSRAVESLRIGDTVLRAEGGTAQVRWIGRQTLRPWLGGPDKARLVRIAAGALGCGLPLRDLCVTPDHALMLEGFLINAGALVNGAGIEWLAIRDDCTVYHIETDHHDIILADGAAVETFVDYVGRQAFDNHDEYVALYGTELGPIPENTAPRITTARMVPQPVRARLGLHQAA
jgi:hypothetical protein